MGSVSKVNLENHEHHPRNLRHQNRENPFENIGWDCPLINRFEVLLKEDEEGEPDHMRGF
jgi:hypothetical protein